MIFPVLTFIVVSLMYSCTPVASECKASGEGVMIGWIKPTGDNEHMVKGMVYAIADMFVHVTNFSFDGKAMDTFFWVGMSMMPDMAGQKALIFPDMMDKGLMAYTNADLVVRLPDGMTIHNIKWFAVYDIMMKQSFGQVPIPDMLMVPEPFSLGMFKNLGHDDHGITKSGEVWILDGQTFQLSMFMYDGMGAMAHFRVGMNSDEDMGTLLPDENGSMDPLHMYDGSKNITIVLPSMMTVCDYGYLSVFDVKMNDTYAKVLIPMELNVQPNYGQNRHMMVTTTTEMSTTMTTTDSPMPTTMTTDMPTTAPRTTKPVPFSPITEPTILPSHGSRLRSPWGNIP